jgi:hypothetical protein
MLNGGATPDWNIARESILFALEPNDYAESSDLRLSLSRRVDQRLGTWQWINREMLEEWGVMIDDNAKAAYAGVTSALTSSKLERSDVEGVTVGFFETTLPLKSSLLLAPNPKGLVWARVAADSGSAASPHESDGCRSWGWGRYSQKTVIVEGAETST